MSGRGDEMRRDANDASHPTAIKPATLHNPSKPEEAGVAVLTNGEAVVAAAAARFAAPVANGRASSLNIDQNICQEGAAGIRGGSNGPQHFLTNQQMYDLQRRHTHTYMHRKRELQEEGYLSAFRFIPSPQGNMRQTGTGTATTRTTPVEMWPVRFPYQITYSKYSAGGNGETSQRRKRVRRRPRRYDSSASASMGQSSSDNSSMGSNGSSTKLKGGRSRENEASSSMEQNSSEHLSIESIGSSPEAKRARSPANESSSSMEPNTYAESVRHSPGKNSYITYSKESTTRIPNLIYSKYPVHDLEDVEYNVYYPPSQLVSELIDIPPGIAFQGFDDSDGEVINPADRFLDRPNVKKWKPTINARNLRKTKKRGPKPKTGETRHQISERYGARMNIAGVSVNLGSDHYTSMNAAAALDIAKKLLHGRNNESPYNVLSENEVVKTLKAVGFGAKELDRFQFKKTFDAEKKKAFESTVEQALSCIGGRDDNLAEILCDIETMEDVHHEKKVNGSLPGKENLASRSEKKRKGGKVSEHHEYNRQGKHLVYLVDDKGKFTFELDKSIKPHTSDGKGR